jgi:hypothetical protein
MKKNRNEQKRMSGKCENLFQQEVRECCNRQGQYSDNVIRNVCTAVFPEFVHKCFRCKDDRDFLYFNADIICELVHKCLTRNLTHFRYRDRRWKRGAAALCRKAVQSDFVLIGIDHKYTKYKPSNVEAVDMGDAVGMAG